MTRRINTIATLSLLLACVQAAWAQSGSVSYHHWDNGAFEEGSCQEYTEVTSQTTSLGEGWYVVSGDVTISSRIGVDATAHVILTDGSKLTAEKGISVLQGRSLFIYGQEANSGQLVARGETNAAAIGGGNEQNCGSVIIHGGTFNLNGGSNGAAIGGGHAANGGSVVIYGGSVNATGGYHGAGIGGGGRTRYEVSNGGNGGTVTIYGGTVVATGTDYAAGIGGGDGGGDGGSSIHGGDGGTVFIMGGKVTARSTAYDDQGFSGGYGIGPSAYPHEGSQGIVQMGWTNQDDYIDVFSTRSVSCRAKVELLNYFFLDGTTQYAGPANMNGKKIVPGPKPAIDGDGTAEAPYAIATAAHWDVVRNLTAAGLLTAATCYQQTDDITVTTMVGTASAPFHGTYNGQGHTLTVSFTGSERFTAPFSYVQDANISNLHVKGTMSGSRHSGGLIGDAGSGTNNISNCRVSTAITTNSITGGYVGHAQKSTTTITGCLFDGAITLANADDWSFGAAFVGWFGQSDATISLADCLEQGAYTGNFKLLGMNIHRDNNGETARSQATNSYNTHQWSECPQPLSITTDIKEATFDFLQPKADYVVSGITAYDAGYMFGGTRYAGSGETIPFAITYTGDIITSSGTINTETAPLQLTLGDADAVISLDPASWGGSGTQDDPYAIYVAAQLDKLAERVNAGNSYEGAYFRLMDDIAYSHDSDWNNTESDEENYTAIGTKAHPFKGHFDGCNHVVSGIRIYREGGATHDEKPQLWYQGLFGYTEGSTISNVVLADMRVTAYRSVGSLVGEQDNSTVSNCHVLGDVCVYANTAGANTHGGIVGYSYRSTIENSSSMAAVTFDSSSKASRYTAYGGIVGENRGSAAASSTIASCLYLGGNVASTAASGSIVGTNTSDYGPITDSYDGAADDADNSGFISLLAKRNSVLGSRAAHPFAINGRTLYKDGSWNTLCLPFGINELKGTSLEGATVMQLDAEGTYDGQQTGFDPQSGILYLYFKTATSIQPGVPYIVRWGNKDSNPGTKLASPVFGSVTAVDEAPADHCVTSSDGSVRFIGTYNPALLEQNVKTNLYLGADNTLYYPTAADLYVNAFHAYFQLTDPTLSVRQVVLNFFDEQSGEGEHSSETAIFNAEANASRFTLHSSRQEWHALDGRRLSAKPTRSGIYVNQGRKVVVK